MLNINKTKDPFYRYKMHKIEIQKIGRGNGCNTMLINLDTIEEDLGHPSEIIFKFIGHNLGVKVDKKKNTVGGHHEYIEIQATIFKYIDIFVICQKCGIPEIIPVIIKKTLVFRCSACGENYKIVREPKTCNNILKYLETNVWEIKKGTIVEKEETKEDDFDFF